ncbi:MAG: 50S ribosomal protein L3 [Lentisphaeria bacterium]|nr:50S ribosomal protein L3 [Lentisphaeria bacterium]MBR2625908.1 50S ribosomal protein L3 [Lentisphaeria bacterium]
MKGLIGKKLGMTQVYDEKGVLTPVTVIEVGPCVVTDVKTVERDGYSAIQLGFGSRKAKNVTKARKGHLAKAGITGETLPALLREIRGAEAEVGAILKADIFSAGEYLDVIGVTKGRGFQGVVKRWNFGGGRASHGGAWERRPGSIGCCEWPGRVNKGKKMPGHYGNDRRTVQNLQIVRVMADDNCLLVKGAIPGCNGGIVTVKSALKKPAAK